MAEISNNALAVLMIIALAVSVVGTLSTLDMLKVAQVPTGFVVGQANVTVNSTTTITLPVSSIDFGTMNVPSFGSNYVNDTTDGSPPPFQIANNGSVVINITVGAEDLWTTPTSTACYGGSASNPTACYQYKCGDLPGGASCSPEGVTTFTNMNSTANPYKVIAYLDYKAGNDTLEVEINVSVPDDEPQGAKGSLVTFTATQA